MIKEDQTGFTLIEVLVAFAVLAGAIIMTFQVFGDGLRGLNNTRERAKEMQIAQSQIELLGLSGSLKVGTTTVTVEKIILRMTIETLKSYKSDGNNQFWPFRVKIFRDEKSAAEPLLETILIAKFYTGGITGLDGTAVTDGYLCYSGFHHFAQHEPH
jgi:prepilin-type N-terminal cleavage/methylation domain-containing protein